MAIACFRQFAIPTVLCSHWEKWRRTEGSDRSSTSLELPRSFINESRRGVSLRRKRFRRAVSSLLDAWPFLTLQAGLGICMHPCPSPADSLQPEDCWLSLWDCICMHMSLRWCNAASVSVSARKPWSSYPLRTVL